MDTIVSTTDVILAGRLMLENEVRAYRTRLGWSQEELASRSGLSRAGISAIETGRLIPFDGRGAGPGIGAGMHGRSHLPTAGEPIG